MLKVVYNYDDFFIKNLIFLCINIKMKQLGRKKAQSKTLKRILGAENTLSDLKKKRKKATCKRFKQKFRGNKCPFKLKQQKSTKRIK